MTVKRERSPDEQRHYRPWRASLSALVLLCSAGCSTSIDGDSDGDKDPQTGSQTGHCGVTADPIRRLTPEEYVNSVAALFPDVTLPDDRPLPDARINGYTNQSAGQSVSELGVRKYEELARTIAAAASTQLESWAPCSEDNAECVREIAMQLGTRAYRRPLTAEETTHIEEFASQAYDDFGLSEGLAIVVQGLLESPWFLFRPEFGYADESSQGKMPLDDYEMASRLSYFFLSTSPDDELLAAAERGELRTTEGIEAQAARLMAEPAARASLTKFFTEWLGVYRLAQLNLDTGTFPEFDTAMRADLERSAELYIDKALWEDDSLDSLLTGTYAFVNDRLAPLFGVEPPGSEELVLVELDPSERRGILTQPALLASTSHGIAHSPILRGVTLLRNVLCSSVPSPPAGILDNLDPVEVPEGEICTTRDKLTKTHTIHPGCPTCHVAIDAAGFAFERYDALGRYRTEENGCSVDSTGTFPAPLGPVDDAVQLADVLAKSPAVAECVTTQALRFALGRADTRKDDCEIGRVSLTLQRGQSLQGLVLDLVLSAPFRTRPAN